ncbi:uracil-DNA glycosylase family protein [Roseicyclus sp. F158]|uniref:Uracil-DNA glycosylase family protein n=1 Tax=Tropicimonas omnivorans TaxID=3075590 RepID=A0ABU3DFF9_9RHOB|nr:uracil-DNA glycosylase family protein [Roseicyclus sp. F158]MDT0682412.1 uracil-DNA glycosylase family protein [Roseicyclus sp. F158]
MNDPRPLPERLGACTICADRFAATASAHRPNPVVWFRDEARLLIASQAPGMRVHKANKPFWDRSGDRLRDWLGLDEATFYDRKRVAIIPMGFCFPGYDAKGGDLPPPKVCAETWRQDAIDYAGPFRLTVLIGGYAQKWHLGPMAAGGVTKTVAKWEELAPRGIFPLPHPSWRNTAWLKRNPWFEADVLPELRAQVGKAIS